MKFRLLKDLPEIIAGAEITEEDVIYSNEFMKEHPNWFEDITNSKLAEVFADKLNNKTWAKFSDGKVLSDIAKEFYLEVFDKAVANAGYDTQKIDIVTTIRKKLEIA